MRLLPRSIGVAVTALVLAAGAAGACDQALATSSEASRAGADPRLQIDRGIVVAVRARTILLRELDGVTVRLLVGPRTRVLVDGDAASLAAIRRGFVAVVYHQGRRPARLIEAYDTGSS